MAETTITAAQREEYLRLKKRMEALQEIANEKDATGKPTRAALLVGDELATTTTAYQKIMADIGVSERAGGTTKTGRGQDWDIIPGPNGSQYTIQPQPDGTFKVVPALAPNPDKDQQAAVENQVSQATRDARQRNQDATGYYVDDVQRAQIEDWARKNNLTQAEINARLLQIANENRNTERRLANEERKTTADIGLTGAQTTKVGAETDQIRETIRINNIKTQADVDRMEAQNLVDRATADKIRAEIGRLDRPTVQTVDTSAQFTSTYDPRTGQFTYADNRNWQPKDTANQIVQMQQLATQKRDELNALVQAGKIDGQTATNQFNTWWDANVEPRRAGITQAQEQLRFENQIKASAEGRQAMTVAQQAGQNAVANYQAGAKNRVGPGYEAAMQGILDAYKNGTTPGPISAKGMVWKAPDMNKMAETATMEALKNISPFAAHVTGNAGGGGLQMPNMLDVGGALDRTRYSGQWAGAPPPPAPAAVTAEVPVAPATPQPATPMPGLAAPGVAGTVAPGQAMYLGNATAPGGEASPYDPMYWNTYSYGG